MCDSIRKQFSKETGDTMSALPATVSGLSVDVPVDTVRRALAYSYSSRAVTQFRSPSAWKGEGW